MPIYDYACESCGHVVEVIHPISGTGPATCERCGGRMKRALSAPAIVFKGSGWAKKDARDASRSKSTAATKAGDAAGSTEPAAATGSASGASEPGAATTSTGPAPAASDAGGSSKASTTATPTSGVSSGSGPTG